MSIDVLSDWSTTAVNLPDHADNKIHTDEGARAAGFLLVAHHLRAGDGPRSTLRLVSGLTLTPAVRCR